MSRCRDLLGKAGKFRWNELSQVPFSQVKFCSGKAGMVMCVMFSFVPAR